MLQKPNKYGNGAILTLANIYTPTEIVPMGKTYPVVDSHNVRGGFISVDSLAQLSDIDISSHVKDGNLAYDSDSRQYYKYSVREGAWVDCDFVYHNTYLQDVTRIDASVRNIINVQDSSYQYLSDYIYDFADTVYEHIQAEDEAIYQYVDNLVAKTETAIRENVDASIININMTLDDIDVAVMERARLTELADVEHALSLAINQCSQRIDTFNSSIDDSNQKADAVYASFTDIRNDYTDLEQKFIVLRDLVNGFDARITALENNS